jgi:two-component system response regulator RegA
MNILVIDDDDKFRNSLIEEFIDHDFNSQGFSSFAEIELSELKKFTHAVVDLRLKNENGIEIVGKLKKENSEMRIIMLTGFGSIATAVNAVKSGADDYLAKPIDIEILIKTLQGIELVENDNEEITEMSLARHEREYIELILDKCEGNISKAARVLGLHRQSLQRMLKKYPLKN